MSFNRDAMLEHAKAKRVWDLLVIGGGATGLGTALEAASRGYATLCLEQGDFAQGASSRSTKLVHGGVRYLQQGNLSLVREALSERARILANAPHLARRQAFVIPVYRRWEGPYYAAGLKLYDLLAGGSGLGGSRLLSRTQTLVQLPGVESKGLQGGVLYFDGQFEDARLALALASTAAEQGGVLLNYAEVVSLARRNGRVVGAVFRDRESGEEIAVEAKLVINAAGAFADVVRRLEAPEAPALLAFSQGAHIVLDASFLPGEAALMLPKTPDGRVLFAIPWLGRTVIGTTDVEIPAPQLAPAAQAEEIAYLLELSGRYLARPPKLEDVRSVFVGVRPLVRPAQARAAGTAGISREHLLTTSPGGLLTITGGKWTTYRRMAQETVDRAAKLAGLPKTRSVTAQLALYGADRRGLQALLAEAPELNAPLHPDLPYLRGEVVHSARHEMARTLEDVLARRTRALFLDARAALASAPEAVALLARELGHDAEWERAELARFEAVARAHLPTNLVPAP